MRVHLLKAALFLFCLAALALPAAKVLGLVDWSWWIIAAPLWLTCIVVLAAGGALAVFLVPRPPR